MSVILPFDNDTIIKTYPHYCFYFGILSGNKIVTNKFVFNRFIPIYFIKTQLYFDFFGSIALIRLFKRKKFSSNMSNPVDFIKDNIDHGKYIQIYLNHKNISSVNISSDFVHDFLIYGYDEDNKHFYMTGYTADNRIKPLVVRDFLISYDELIESYKNAEESSRPPLCSNFVVSIKRNPEQKIKKWKVKFDIFCFLHSPFSFFGQIFFNLRSIERFIDFLDDSIEKKSYYFDIRILKILQEHVQILYKFEQELSMSVEKTEKSRSLYDLTTTALVYATLTMSRNNMPDQYYYDHFIKIRENMEEIKQKEIEILKDIYNTLKEK